MRALLALARLTISHVHGTTIYGRNLTFLAEKEAAQARDITDLDRRHHEHVKPHVATPCRRRHV
jgi:hypothetical protein